MTAPDFSLLFTPEKEIVDLMKSYIESANSISALGGNDMGVEAQADTLLDEQDSCLFEMAKTKASAYGGLFAKLHVWYLDSEVSKRTNCLNREEALMLSVYDDLREIILQRSDLASKLLQDFFPRDGRGLAD